MLKIIKANQPIPVKQITVTVYALPGIGKTSLAFSAGALLIDTDKGSYRSGNRGDTVQPASWSEIANLTAPDLEGYGAVALDTAGRALDMLSAHILENDPKMGRKSGELSLQGFGALKSSFTSWLKRLHACGKDVILLSHMDEKMEGDIVKERLDVQGGSKAEIYKCSDAIAKLYIDGKARRLDFSPREGSLGKNPAQFDLLTVPSFAVEPQYFGTVLANIKAALNRMSEAQIQAQDELKNWRKLLHACTTAADFNALLPQASKADQSVKILVMAEATAKGLKFDKGENVFYAPSVTVGEPDIPKAAEKPNVAQKSTVAPQQPSGDSAGKPFMDVEYVDPAKSKCGECGSSFGVHLKTCSHFVDPRAKLQPTTNIPDEGPMPDDELYEQVVNVSDVEKRNRKGHGQFLLLTCSIPEGGDLPLQCWHVNTMFDALLKSMGKECVFGLKRHEKDGDAYYTIEKIVRIGAESAGQPTALELFA